MHLKQQTEGKGRAEEGRQSEAKRQKKNKNEVKREKMAKKRSFICEPAYIIIHTLSIFFCYFLSGYTFNRVEFNVQSGMFVVYTLLS